jgi:hypothetical protein
VADLQMFIIHIFHIVHLESTSTVEMDDVASFDISQNDGYGLVGGKMQLNHACTKMVDITWKILKTPGSSINT